MLFLERGGIFDWEEFLDKHRASFDENLSGKKTNSRFPYLICHHAANSKKQWDESSDLDEQSSEEAWLVDKAVERVERLQATDQINSLEKQRRRNDTLFIGM